MHDMDAVCDDFNLEEPVTTEELHTNDMFMDMVPVDMDSEISFTQTYEEDVTDTKLNEYECTEKPTEKMDNLADNIHVDMTMPQYV